MGISSTAHIWIQTTVELGTPGIKTALRPFSVNLGHPTNEDLTRCLTTGGGTRVALKCMRCSACERMIEPRSHRPSRIPTNGQRFNEKLFVDLRDVVDVCGSRYWWLVAVDQHTSCTVIATSPSHESEVVAKTIFQTLDSVGRTPRRTGVRRRMRPGSLRDFHCTTLCQELRCEPQLHIFRGKRMELSGGSQPSRKWRARRFCNIQELAGKSATSIVSYEVSHALIQRAGRLGIPPVTRLFGQRMKVHGELMEHGVHHPTVVDQGAEQGRRFIMRTSSREALEEHVASKAIKSEEQLPHIPNQ